MPEQEYADFSDMTEKALPNEEPLPAGNLSVQYIETSEGETQKEEPVKEVLPKEDPNSFQFWQSQADKREKELQETRRRDAEQLQAMQREIEKLREQSTPKPKDEPLVKPQRPNSDDPLDLIKWQSEMFEYQEKLLQKQQEKFQSTEQVWQQEIQRRQQEEEYARQKAYHLSQLQRTGLSPEEANEAFIMYSKAQEDPEQYYKDLGEYYRFKRGQFGSPKGEQMGKRVARQGEVPSLVNVPSEAETQKKDPSDEFFGDMKNVINRFY